METNKTEQTELPDGITVSTEYDSAGRTVKESCYDSEQTLLYMLTYTRDSQGNIIKITRLHADGSYDFDLYYLYDKNNRLLKESKFVNESLDYFILYDYDAEGRPLPSEKCTFSQDENHSWESVYSEEGLLIRQDEYERSSLCEHLFYTYDEQNRLIRKCLYNVDTDAGEKFLYWTIEYHYNEQGKMTDERKYTGEERKPAPYKEYSYDANGRTIAIRKYRANGTQSGESRQEYDEAGRCIREIYRQGPFLESDICHYDANGLLTETISCDRNDKPEWRVIYQYDAENRMIRKIRYKADSEKQYGFSDSEYDEKGNLIRVCTYEGEKTLTSISSYTYDEKGREIKSCFYVDYWDRNWNPR